MRLMLIEPIGLVSTSLSAALAPIAALDVLLLSLLKQVGSRGHTNSHCHPHLSAIGDQVEVRVGRVIRRGR